MSERAREEIAFPRGRMKRERHDNADKFFGGEADRPVICQRSVRPRERPMSFHFHIEKRIEFARHTSSINFPFSRSALSQRCRAPASSARTAAISSRSESASLICFARNDLVLRN